MSGEERPACPQNLILENRKHLSVSGVEEVSGFDESFVRVRTVLGDLTVLGEGLAVESLSVEAGELTLSGSIRALEYRQREQPGGFLARLLG